jgi:hypothetical protein
MKLTYSKQHKLAAIEYIRNNNPHISDPEGAMNDLIQTAVESDENVTAVSCAGIHISISQTRMPYSDQWEDEIMLDFYVSPCFNLDDEDWEYVTEDV